MSKDCTSCGVCCWYPKNKSMGTPLTPDDTKRLPEEYRVGIRYIGGVAFMPVVESGNGYVCAAYRGGFNEPGAGCSIYEHRPQICRDYKVDGVLCNMAIKRFKIYY